MALQLPREPRSGEQVAASAFAMLVRYVKSITPRTTDSIRWEVLPGGARGYAARGGGRRGTKAVDPFTPYDTSTVGAPKVSFTPGLVDNIIPTLGGVSLVMSPEPKLSLTLAAGVVWIKNTVDAAGVITESIIEQGAALPADTSTLAYRRLAYYTTEAGAIKTLYGFLTTNQSHKRCGGYSTWGAA